MNARAGYHRFETYNESFSREQGGKESRYNSSFSRSNKRYAPYQKQQTQTWKAKEKMEKRQELEMISYEPNAHGMKSRQIDSPSPKRSADISMDDRSSRKKIASAIVTPSRQDRDENIIGALNDMDTIGTSNMDDGDRENSLMVEDHADDLLGDELMDMDVEATKDAAAAGAKSVQATKGKPSATSSHKRGEAFEDIIHAKGEFTLDPKVLAVSCRASFGTFLSQHFGEQVFTKVFDLIEAKLRQEIPRLLNAKPGMQYLIVLRKKN
ncbi:hypothetical protein DY000_02053379 [Brassica cretica]|uniref:MIF4G domain-containing protein n=1 Tax=Brassica cretica TaxID=69181 RepID=A0ABQ7ALZ3_BRACR|nr:hypothetical protein DY000_02053379 [Brassica cretica]